MSEDRHGNTEWRLIESAPKDGTRILACHCDHGTVQLVDWLIKVGAWDNGDVCWEDKDFTHWMPIPELPK